jgi:hypothetical protein
MKVLMTRKRSLASLSLVLCVCFVVASYFGRPSEAENRGAVSLEAKIESVVPEIFEDLVPNNPANIRFVRAGKMQAERSEADVSRITPLTLASGDLNADGLPDLVCGYAVPGGGLVTIYYGDARAFAPTDPTDIQAAIENRYRAPFSGSRTIRLDHAPDFFFTGDFDRDSPPGHHDRRDEVDFRLTCSSQVTKDSTRGRSSSPASLPPSRQRSLHARRVCRRLCRHRRRSTSLV